MKSPKIRSLCAVLLALGGLGAATARANEPAFYAGGSLGVPRYQDSVNGVSGSGNGASGKVFGGYQITPNVGVEVGYADLGHIDNSTGRVDGRAGYVDAVGTLPLGDKFSLIGSAGVTHVDLDTSAGDGSGNGLKLGLGAQYALTGNLALRAEAERYHASAFDAKPDIDQYTVGLRLRF